MPTKQGISTPTLLAVLPAGTAVRTMAVHSNGLHHGDTNHGGVRPAIGDHRSIHQNGPLSPSEEKQENRDRPGNSFRQRSMEIPRPPR